MANQTKQVRIDAELHRQLKLESYQSGITITQYAENALRNALESKEARNIHRPSTSTPRR